MSTTWIKVAKGIRYREHPSRKAGIRKDRYYSIFYKYQGKSYNEGVGWASEGIKQEDCESILSTLRKHHKSGIGAKTYKDIRNENIAREETEKAQQLLEKKMTLPVIFDDYISAQISKNPKTVIIEKRLMATHILPFFNDISIFEINSRKLDEFLKYLQEKISDKTGKELSSATIRYTIAVLRQIWNYALTRDMVNNSFPLRAKQPKTDNKRTRFLTREEANILLEELEKRSQYIHDVALISLYCGLRLGEILKLQWGDVNFAHELTHVRDRKNRESGIAYLPANVLAMLKCRYHDKYKVSDFIFSNNDGSAKTYMSKTFSQTVEDLGFNKDITDRREKVVFHTLRHTFASWLAQQGVSMFELAELMGHKDITMTQRYSHHSPDKLRKAAMLITNE